MTVADTHRALRELLLAYERLDALWRRESSLSANETLVVMFLSESVKTPGELTKTVGITSAGMTTLLDRLEDAGFVRREAHPSDKRRVLLSLTKRGLQARLQFEQVTQRIAEAAQRMGAAEPAIQRFLVDATDIAERYAEERDVQRTG